MLGTPKAENIFRGLNTKLIHFKKSAVSEVFRNFLSVWKNFRAILEKWWIMGWIEPVEYLISYLIVYTIYKGDPHNITR